MATKDWEIRAVEIGQALIATDFIGCFFVAMKYYIIVLSVVKFFCKY